MSGNNNNIIGGEWSSVLVSVVRRLCVPAPVLCGSAVPVSLGGEIRSYELVELLLLLIGYDPLINPLVMASRRQRGAAARKHHDQADDATSRGNVR